MKLIYIHKALVAGSIISMLSVYNASADVNVQCPCDLNGDADCTDPGEIYENVLPEDQDIKCMHLGSGDGYATMADGSVRYIFGFSDMTGIPTNPPPADVAEQVLSKGMLAAAYPAPVIELNENQEFYLTLTNVGMVIRPDLFDPHTVHFHGLPNATPIFDGLPESGISINMGSSLTYYYKLNDPGTYMYHCHVEAAEHMQMGMVGNLYVHPEQNGTPYGYGGKTYTQFAYNDGDGSTGYDVDIPIQLGSFDSAFHDASENTQPLPFALMFDNYPTLNGRGYPDTIIDEALPSPDRGSGSLNNSIQSQVEDSLITAAPGQRVLLRLSNLSITRPYSIGTMGVTMLVVGKDARQLKSSGPSPVNLYYATNSLTVGPGESFDAIVEIPENASTGDRYFLYTTNLNYLVNSDDNTDGLGGMMTEIQVVN